MLPYEMKFLVPNYSCLQNPWLGGYRPQIPVLSVLNWICWTPPPKKNPGYATDEMGRRMAGHLTWMLWRRKNPLVPAGSQTMIIQSSDCSLNARPSALFGWHDVNCTFYHRCKTGTGTHPVYKTVGDGCSFFWGKVARAWSWPLCSSAEVKNAWS